MDASHATASLLAQLESLADCAQAEGFACITARHEHGARSVDIAGPQLAILLRGRKRVRSADASLMFAPGDLFVVTRRCRIDVVNTPDPHSGLYLSAIIPLCEEALAAARTLWNEPLPAAGADIARCALAEFGAPLLQWRDALAQGRYTEARLALSSLIIGLCRRGHGSLLLPPARSVSAQLRALVAARPDYAWQARDFEERLAISGATLRRRLAAERTSVRELLADARLAHAMELLYTTRLPLKTIASRVGYRSVGSFRKRFNARYGLEPSAIGNG